MALMSTILSYLVGPTLLGLFVGRWLDNKVNSEPLFLVLGLLIGLASGIYGMLYAVRQFFSGDS
nr:AtpZ/AtpI family protein [Sutcliffiella rhizosphaerae]